MTTDAPGGTPVGGGPSLPESLRENLQLITDGVVAVAGFAVAAIRIRRGDDLVVVAVSGHRDGIGARLPVGVMHGELAVAEDWGSLQFVPHERSTYGDDEAGWVVTGREADDHPDAWHPLDMLVAPLYDAQGELRGTLAIDEPLDGRRPGPERREVLTRFARLAGRAVISAVEEERLAEQVAMANTVKSVVRTTSAQLSLDGLLAASERTLLDGFAAQGLWIKTVAADEGHAVEYLPDDVREALPEEIVTFAEQAAEYCWRQQAVMTVGAGYPLPERMSQHHFDYVVDLLAGMGMASLVFVPLGAGPECMGSLVLMRADARRDWTTVECAALLDIGHDLGRAALNARTFEHEHALVTELRALDTYKSQLISTVSHELKNPLTAVTGHLEILQDGEIALSEDGRASLEAIGRASHRMSRVIEDLLLLRKVGDGEKPLDRVPVALDRLVRDVLELTAMQAAKKLLHVTLIAPAGTVTASGERDDLDKVVLNLISNAVKYTPEGREVRVTLDVDRDSRESILRVSDDGIGISAADQEHLFTEFFRSADPLASSQPGTGLGLAIVKRIVERHGGRIEVSSEAGKGSTFTVTLPAEDPSRPEAPVPTQGRGGRRRTAPVESAGQPR